MLVAEAFVSGDGLGTGDTVEGEGGRKMAQRKRTWRRLPFLVLMALMMGSMALATPVMALQGTPQALPVASGTGLATIPIAPGSKNPDADPNATVTLNLGAEIDSGDPQVYAFLNEIEIGSKVYAPLLALNEKNQVADAGAVAMQVSDDGKTYTFKIREGMTYSDGTPVTAADYAYGIKRACSPVVAGNYSNILYSIVGCEDWRSADPTADKDKLPQLEAAVDGAIQAVDDHTLQIKLTQAAGYFPYVMATWVTYPVRKDLVEGNGANWWKDPKNYIGNGPFKLVSHKDKQEWVFERNESYFRGAPGIKTLIFKEIDNSQTEFLAYQKGELDMIAPASSFLPQIQADAKLKDQMQRQTGANTYYMAYNMQDAPFNDLKVRQAFAFALNRQQYVDQILNGVGEPAGTFLYPGIPGYQEEYQQTYNPDKAKQLLADAGFPDGKGFPQQQLRYVADDPVAQQRATFWAQNIKQVLNIDLQLVPTDQAQLQSLRTNRDPSLTIYLGNWFEDYPHPQDWLSLVFGPGSTRSPLGWNDQHFYDLVTKADALPIDQATPIYQEADAYLAEQAPAAFYLHSASLILIHPNMKGYVSYPTSVFDTTYQIEKIYKTAS
jgi:oligopeptide transport system substrate-binding protein